MMQANFLSSIAGFYTSKTDFSSYCFVFPGRRTGLFFSKYLSSYISKPVWAPKVITINELFEEYTDYSTADNISLLFILHSVYNRVLHKEISFDDFISIGETLISDFDDIDKHLINAKQLYTNLSDIKQLDDDYSHLTKKQLEAIKTFWGAFNTEKFSTHQKEFISLWDNLYEIYSEFRKELKNKNMVYSGMHYRNVAEDIINNKFKGYGYEKLIFAGFNALTPAEDKLFEFLKNHAKADFFWDYSEWINNLPVPKGSISVKSSGPGYFIKENTLKYPSPEGWKLPMNEHTESQDITISPVSTSMDQLTVINDFLKESDRANMNTALVLTDENMLLPALYGIPEKVDRINVTMGYPLKNTPAYGLIELLFELQLRLRESKNNKVWFHHKLVTPILQHQYITLLEPEHSKELLTYIIKENSLFPEQNELHINNLFTLIFRKIKTSEELSEYLKEILYKIAGALSNEKGKEIEREFLYNIYQTIVRLDDILNEYTADTLPETWFRLLKKLLEYRTVPFEGEPLGGLQVMGILETRALDFDNLIILNLNENIFPKTTPAASFIPYSLRTGFGLPTIEYQDNIYSYYFFRLIHRAKKVSLLYTTDTDGMKSGEMSRFLYLLNYLYPVKPKLKQYREEVTLIPSPAVKTIKNKNVLNALNEFLTGHRTLSPSTLSKYMECPMRFYYSNVAGIKEPEEIMDEADSRIFGKIFHTAIENLFRPFIDKQLSSDLIDALIQNTANTDRIIEEAFKKEISPFDFQKHGFNDLYGNNLILKEVTKKYILELLEKEKSYCPFTISGLELDVETEFSFDNKTVKIKGTIDRIDKKDNIIRIIDYKTGSSKNIFSDIDTLFSKEKHSDLKAIFQTFLYSYILKKDKNDSGILYSAGIINTKELFNKSYTPDIKRGNRSSNAKEIYFNEVESEFVKNMKLLLSEIFDPSVPFEQVSDKKKCDYCPYKSICRR
ncbi:MAG: DUF2800 domain-containing protein [Chlorobi bacterium]|nr:DUF2800 domain-containing protein [Chlorobiota bacterium]